MAVNVPMTTPVPVYSSKEDIWARVCTLIGEQHQWCATTRPTPTPSQTPSFLYSFAAVARFAALPELQTSRTVVLGHGPLKGELTNLLLDEMKVRLLELVPGMHGQYKEIIKVGAGGDLVSLGMIDSMKTPVDMFVVGSMGVDSRGYRVGQEGDLTGIDFILSKMGRSIKYIVTLVHDCQVFDEIPPGILSKHDLPVDIIITPSRVIRVVKKLNKPANINWSILRNDLKNRIPLHKGLGVEDLLKVNKLKEGVCAGIADPKSSEAGECGDIATRPMLVTNKVKRNQMNMASKFKFDNIPSAVGYQEFKQMLRGRKIVAGFCVITLRAGSAVVAFKEISRVVREKLKGFEFWSSKIKMQEVGVEVEANPNVKSDVAQKRKEVEKIRHKIMLETFEKLRVQNYCGVFMGKLPFGTTENELREALEAQNLIPVTLDMGHRNRFAIAFFVEELEVLLSLLGAMLLQGKEILVEEYDPHKREGLGEGEVESSTDGTRVEGN